MGELPDPFKDDDERNLVKLQVFKNYHNLTKRLKKTCYYGKGFSNTPSFPLSLIMVDFFNRAAKKEDLKRLDPNYVEAVSSGTCITPCSIVLGMMYVEQLCENNPSYLQTISPSELFLVSMMVAFKYIEEHDVYLVDFAHAGKETIKDLIQLEMNFLDALEWKVGSSPQAVLNFLTEIEYAITLTESAKRGWYTYADLWMLSEKLSKQKEWNAFITHLSTVLSWIILAYLACLVALLGTFMVAHQLMLIHNTATPLNPQLHPIHELTSACALHSLSKTTISNCSSIFPKVTIIATAPLSPAATNSQYFGPTPHKYPFYMNGLLKKYFS